MPTLFINGKVRQADAVQIRNGRVICDGADVTPDGCPVIEIRGDIKNLTADGKTCVVIEGQVHKATFVSGPIGSVVVGSVTHNAPVTFNVPGRR